MLKGIPRILPPKLLCALCEMGHGDKICIADANFPAESVGKNSIVIRMDGHTAPEVLDAILTLLPLDTYVEAPVTLMELMECDKGRIETPIWDKYKEIIGKYDGRGASCVSNIDRFEFYERAKEAYCIIATGESAVYANIMLQKGVL